MARKTGAIAKNDHLIAYFETFEFMEGSRLLAKETFRNIFKLSLCFLLIRIMRRFKYFFEQELKLIFNNHLRVRFY